jgi:hypothetical protein
MFTKRTSNSLGVLVIAVATVTMAGCLTEPKDGQNIGVRFLPFRAAGYWPDIYQNNPNIVLQAKNHWTGQWEWVGNVQFAGQPRYKDGHWYYPWHNNLVVLAWPHYWQTVGNQWRAEFRAYDLASGIACPPSDDATLTAYSNADHVRLYADW